MRGWPTLATDEAVTLFVAPVVDGARLFVDALGVPNLNAAEQRQQYKRLRKAIDHAVKVASACHQRILMTIEGPDPGSGAPGMPLRFILTAARAELDKCIARTIPPGKNAKKPGAPRKLTTHRVAYYIVWLLAGIGVDVKKLATRDEHKNEHGAVVRDAPAVEMLRAALVYYGLPTPKHLRPYLDAGQTALIPNLPAGK